MLEEARDELERIERSARSLLNHVKRLNSPKLQLPLRDDTCVWLITIERISILDDD